jgi:hypothetical protein
MYHISLTEDGQRISFGIASRRLTLSESFPADPEPFSRIIVASPVVGVESFGILAAIKMVAGGSPRGGLGLLFARC